MIKNDSLMSQNDILQNAWQKKKSLQKAYLRVFESIKGALAPGTVLEVGSGIGKLKNFLGDRCTATDIHFHETINVICDGLQLPFCDNSYSNVVAVNVFHHIKSPFSFLQELNRVVKYRGKIILVEPYMTHFNRILFKYFHHEPYVSKLDRSVDLYENRYYQKGNNAFGHWFFNDNWALVEQNLRGIELHEKRLLGSIIDSLNGGFCHQSVLPDCLCRVLSRLRRILSVNRLDASRFMVVMKKCQ